MPRKTSPRSDFLTVRSPSSRTKPCHMEVMRQQCATCPFRKGSPYEFLRGDLAASAMSEASRICHSTGSNNGINHRTGKPPALCRGARDIQLQYFHAIGFLPAATDEAWAAKWAEMQSR